MGIINQAKSGADLTRPSLSVGWLIGGTFAAAMLFLALGLGGYLYRKSKAVVSSVAPSSDKGVLSYTSGIFGDGS